MMLGGSHESVADIYQLRCTLARALFFQDRYSRIDRIDSHKIDDL